MAKHWIDIQHRGFTAYEQETRSTEADEKLSRAIRYAGQGVETVRTIWTGCEVDTDWIERIEAALPYVENAVRENRQFIHREGDTVPIEKAKRVSKTSVEHLSRHSELITRLPENGEDLIPERIYVTENIGTYVVYENRFLYMLLGTLRDFVELRFRGIQKCASNFSSNVVYETSVKDGDRSLQFSLHFEEMSSGVDGTCDRDTMAILERLQRILLAVELLLKTDLIKEVSTAPLLNPPIARTNVLLQNPNFKMAVELYDYLVAYDKKGFEDVERFCRDGVPTDGMRMDFASLVSLTSYLTYRHGGMERELMSRYREEERQRRLKAEQAQKEKLAALKAKVGDVNDRVAEYLVSLESFCAEVERDRDALAVSESLFHEAERNFESQKRSTEKYRSEAEKLNLSLQEKETELQNLALRHECALNEVASLTQRVEHGETVTDQRIATALEKQKAAFMQEYEALLETHRLLRARFHSLAQTHGLLSEDADFSSKEAFAELEEEYAVYKRFFEQQWKLAKKQIRQEQLWQKRKS